MNATAETTKSSPASADFFSDQVAPQAYFKGGIMGGPGDGKTYTGAQIIIGLHQRLKALGLPEGDNPVAILETSEFGAHFIKPLFDAAGIPIKYRKTTAFAELQTAFRLAAERKMILFVSSVTGFWVELVEAYKAELNRVSLSVEEWGPIKSTWAGAMEDYKNLPFHCLLEGRAGFEYERSENEATGRMELNRVGIKMAAEGSTGYEPSLLILMRKAQDLTTPATPRTFRLGTVMKDRAFQIDGRSYENPGFAEFAPHFDALALGGNHGGISDANSRHLVKDPRSGKAWHEEKTCVLDEIDALIDYHRPGQSSDMRKARVDLLNKFFGTLSKDRLKTMGTEFLRRGYSALHRELTGVDPVAPHTPDAADAMNPLAERFATGPDEIIPGPGKDGRPTAITSDPQLLGESDADYVARKQAAADKSRADAASDAEVEKAMGAAPEVKRAKPGRKPKADKTAEVSALAAPAAADGKPAEIAAAAERAAANEAVAAGAEAATPNALKTPPLEAPAVKRGRGRPKGSKNKPVPTPAQPAAEPAPATPEADGVKPGARDALAAATGPAEDAPQPAKRGRGRPKGSKNKATAGEKSESPAKATETVETVAVGAAEPPPPADAADDEDPAESADPSADISMPSVVVDGADVGTWEGFKTAAAKLAAANGISADDFAAGVDRTLKRARVSHVAKEAIPRELLLDLYAGIEDKTWNPATGEFSAPVGA